MFLDNIQRQWLNIQRQWLNVQRQGRIICVIFFFLTIALGLSPAWALNGPHAWCVPDDPCAACHLPHHAADELLWARVPNQEFTGTKRLCGTCHGTHLFGARDYIFIEEGHDHPLGVNASIKGPAVTQKDWSKFPLKSKEGGEGFYCGSCHNPHQDPFYIDSDNSGDYLREESEGLIENNSQKHYEFCIQCHAPIAQGNARGHGTKDGCFDCHTPHYSPNSGKKIIKTRIMISSSGATAGYSISRGRGMSMGSGMTGATDGEILIPFRAVPNVPGFSDPAAESYAASCYGCHKADGEGEGSIEAPLNGDDCQITYEHHPMGTGADASPRGHQKTAAGPLSPKGELYCGSCHDPHNATNEKYLNPVVIGSYDPAHPGAFCVACHSDKSVVDLEPTPGQGHNQIRKTTEPQNENECLFCHSIHKSANDPVAVCQTNSDTATQDNSSAAADVIMRIPPVNLKWADKQWGYWGYEDKKGEDKKGRNRNTRNDDDRDTRDYEDMCYGCHSRPDIVGSEYTDNDKNALLFDNVDDRYFSHRFDVVPSDNIDTTDPFEDGKAAVSDGPGNLCQNDYGVEEGKIWCGSCHNVHRQNSPPASYSKELRDRRTAYLRTPESRGQDSGSALCVACHSKTPKHAFSHPVDVPLQQDAVQLDNNFKEYVIAGFSGGIGGETSDDTLNGDIVCQSCHSVHSALTSYDGISRDGNINSGKLLIIDNAVEGKFQGRRYPEGSGLCCNCHYNMCF